MLRSMMLLIGRGLRFQKLPGTEPGTEPGTGTAVPIPIPNHSKTTVPFRFQKYYMEPSTYRILTIIFNRLDMGDACSSR